MFRSEIWLITTLFCFGIIAGMVWSWPDSSSKPVDNAAEADGLGKTIASVDAPSVEHFKNFQGAIDEGDRFMLAGNYRSAAESYKRVIDVAPSIQPELSIRFALALELAGYPVQADRAYTYAATTEKDPRLNLLANTGQARIWMEENETKRLLAIEALSNHTLLSVDSESVPMLMGEARLLLGRALLTQAQSLVKSDPEAIPKTWLVDVPFDLESKMEILTDNDAAFSKIALKSEDDNAASNDSIALTDLPPLEPGLRILQRPSSDPELIAMDVSIETWSVMQILGQLGEISQLTFELDSESRQLLRGRSKSIRIRGANMAVLLDSLLIPYNLVWHHDGERVSIQYAGNLSASDRSVFFLNAAHRTLENFALSNSRDIRTSCAMALQGSISMLLGQYDDAVPAFQRLLQTDPSGELAAKIYLNLAMIERSLLRNDEARILLDKSINATLNRDVKAIGYWLISEIELDEGNLELAISNAYRSTSQGSNNHVRAMAAVVQSIAYMLNEDPIASNRALFDSRLAFQNPGELHLASLLGAYARATVANSATQRQHESERLLVSLKQAKLNEDADPIVDYIAAKAFQFQSMDSECIALFQRSLAKTQSEYWRRRIALELALLQHYYGDSASALATLNLIDNKNSDRISILATLEKAQIHLEANSPDLCLSVCHELMGRQLNDDEKKVALKIMGQAYRKKNLHYSAALCFSGTLPDFDQTELPTTDQQ
ncbi:MAG: hypothetical protein R3C03_15600 [Pirellulaceae bacterium]